MEPTPIPPPSPAVASAKEGTPPPIPPIPAKPKNWLIISLVTLVVLLSLGTGGFFAYRYVQLKNQISQANPTPLASPKPTAEAGDVTANWKTYTSPTNSYSFKYPNGLQPTHDIAPAPFENVSVSYVGPKNVIISPQSETFDSYSFSVVTEGSASEINPKTEAEQLQSGDKVSCPDKTKVSFSNVSQIILATKVAYQLTSFCMENTITTFVSDGRDVYTINEVYSNINKNQYKNILAQILSTFKFTDQNNQKDQTGAQRVNCPTARPQVCTMECLQPPPYICGSDGKSYCTVCQACSNSEVSWYVMQATPCEKQ